MDDSWDAYEYASYLRHNWRFPLIACAAAVAIAAGASLVLPKKYTATARIVIEPPAGSDQRVAVAVSPIYLESLKTYESFASSDSLFLRAVERFSLRDNSDRKPIEAWKSQVLRVEVPRNTKILEIRISLRDARKAQELALYLAQQTVELNRKVNAEADQGMLASAEGQWREARRRLERTEAATSEPVEALSEWLKTRTAFRADLARDLAAARMLIAEDIEREKTASPAERENVRTELRLTRARVQALERRLAALKDEIARSEAVLARRTAHQDTLLAEKKDAQAAVAAAEARLRDVRNAAGARGEQLDILDPGITPERPSSPNLPLNVVAAFLLALVGSLGWLTLRFGFLSGAGHRFAWPVPADDTKRSSAPRL